jgi:hypothetical protein
MPLQQGRLALAPDEGGEAAAACGLGSRGGADDSVARMVRRGLERRAVLGVQAQRRGQEPHGAGMRPAPNAPFQGADSLSGETGLLGQRLLGQPGCTPVLPE